MKIAVLIQCHKNPEQINTFVETMANPAFSFFVHVDKKSSISEKIKPRDDVWFLPDDMRVDAQWATISLVDATLNLLRYANEQGPFDFYWLCSGQDFPIKPVREIVAWFEEHPKNDFVELYKSKNSGLKKENHYDKRNAIFFPHWILGNKKWKRIAKRVYSDFTGGYNHTFKWARRKNTTGLDFFFGSEWICLSKRTFDWMNAYINAHSEYYKYMENCNCSDETFFQTLLMNSPYADSRMDYLHYVDWSEGKSSPKTLSQEDVENLIKSDKLMARKIDMYRDPIIIDILRKMTEE